MRQQEAIKTAREPLLTLAGVTRDFGMGEVVVHALQATDLTVYRGEMLAILGPSGSGKSTLLNIIGGMDRPSSGRVVFGDEVLSQAGDGRLTLYRRRDLGFVFQFYNLIPDLTARENVQLAADLVDKPLPTAEVLAGVGMADRLDHFPSQLSGGEQQRVAIARAVVKNPRLLLCDEPTGALDHQTGKLILGLLARVNREYGATVVIVTHNTAIGALADRVVRMRSGQVVEIRENPEPVPPERIEW